MRTRHRKTRRAPSLLPRRKRDRQRVELLGGAALAVFTLLSVGIFWASSMQHYALRSPEVAAVVSAVLVDLANADRADNDLPPLVLNPTLVAAAQAKANDMATKGYFAHTSPEGLEPWHWFKEVRYSFQYAGENLAIDFSDSGDVNKAWMDSPTHRDNILDPHFIEVGIATAQGMYQGRLTTFVVQEFGTPARGSGQGAVTSASVPKNPAQPALASAVPSDPTVLGTSAGGDSMPVTTSPETAALMAQEVRGQEIPLWGYVMAFPRGAAHIAFYLIAILIVIALILDTGFQMREHHAKKAKHAMYALAVVSILFVMADYLFFAQPVLAALAASL